MSGRCRELPACRPERGPDGSLAFERPVSSPCHRWRGDKVSQRHPGSRMSPERPRWAAVDAEEKLDVRSLLRTSALTRSAEDGALGYEQLLEVECLWRDMETTLELRPMHHHERRPSVRTSSFSCWRCCSCGSPRPAPTRAWEACTGRWRGSASAAAHRRHRAGRHGQVRLSAAQPRGHGRLDGRVGRLRHRPGLRVGRSSVPPPAPHPGRTNTCPAELAVRDGRPVRTPAQARLHPRACAARPRPGPRSGPRQGRPPVRRGRRSAAGPARSTGSRPPGAAGAG